MRSVRARLTLVAHQVATRARANLASAGSSAQVEIEQGNYRNGRAYDRVQHDDWFGEYGTKEIPRHRALGRAIGVK